MYRRQSIIVAIREQIAAKPTVRLSEMASLLGLAPRTIERALKVEGLRLRDMRAEHIVARASALLSSSLFSKKELAFRLGFSSLSAFTHYLERHTYSQR